MTVASSKVAPLLAPIYRPHLSQGTPACCSL
jgi:hypothetical protein